jgi:hypothetical protein
MAKPRSVKKIPGGVTIYDFRGTGACPPVPGSRFRPLVYVHHIPVIKNAAGLSDIHALASVLKNRGLAVQHATDAEGNVALFSRMDEMCWHAKGANSISVGCEHMHFTTDQPWSDRQMRAAAWLAVAAERSFGIPLQDGWLRAGNGEVGVRRRGHTTHEIVSAKAGYNDRSDPGPGFRLGRVYELARYFKRHGRF